MVTDELNKYLEQAVQKCKLETNYFKDNGKENNILPDMLKASHSQDADYSQSNKEPSRTIPESFEEDTGNILEDNTTQIDDGLSTILEEEEDPFYQETVTFNQELNQTDNEHF